MKALSIGIKIIVENTGETFHTIDDWNLALSNNNYIGEPQQETSYINVPYRNGYIDASEAVSGRPIYKERELSFVLGGLRNRLNWDSVISEMRNKVHGKVCRLILDNDKEYFWRGRVYVNDFDRFRELGQFTLSVPKADPYKYDISSSIEPWEWDLFNFETGVIYFIGYIDDEGKHIPYIEVKDEKTVKIPKGHKVLSPTIIVENLESDEITVIHNGRTFELEEGENKIPSILVNGDTEVELTFRGTAKIQVLYRGGSL